MGTPQIIPSNEPLAPLRWSATGDKIYVQHLRQASELPARISLVSVPNGKLTQWKEINPPDQVGVTSVTGVAIGADEQTYVYSYRRILSELYIVEGW